MLKSGYNYIHISRYLRVSGDATVDETEGATARYAATLPPNSPDLYPLDYHVWNGFKKLV
jgi:hypothetical protein